MHALLTTASVHFVLIFVVFSSKSTEYPIRQAHSNDRRTSMLFCVCVCSGGGWVSSVLVITRDQYAVHLERDQLEKVSGRSYFYSLRIKRHWDLEFPDKANPWFFYL